MPFEGGRVNTSGNRGSGIRVDETSSFKAVSVDSSHNDGHGLDMDEGAEVSIGIGNFTHNGGEGIFQRKTDVQVVARARAAIAAPSLNDDELFRALQGFTSRETWIGRGYSWTGRSGRRSPKPASTSSAPWPPSRRCT